MMIITEPLVVHDTSSLQEDARKYDVVPVPAGVSFKGDGTPLYRFAASDTRKLINFLTEEYGVPDPHDVVAMLGRCDLVPQLNRVLLLEVPIPDNWEEIPEAERESVVRRHITGVYLNELPVTVR